jgi:hypothetical protein
MKETVLILSKTHMNNGHACIGGITLKGKYVRLLDCDGENQPETTNLEPRQAWEVDYIDRPNMTAPHVEDILINSRASKGKLKPNITIKDFIEKRNIPIWRGSPDVLFDKLIQWTNSGSGYIDKNGGVPNHSVGFWVSDRDLKRKDYQGIRYQYPSNVGWRSIKFKGFDEPVAIIPAGTLIRVSLARWHSFNENEEPKCWLQLSGWYDLGRHSDEDDDLPF